MISEEQIRHARTVLAERKALYLQVFANPGGQAVLDELASFAHYGLMYSAFNPDARFDDMYAGRQDIVKRIEQFMRLPLDDLFRLMAPEAHEAMITNQTFNQEEPDHG